MGIASNIKSSSKIYTTYVLVMVFSSLLAVFVLAGGGGKSSPSPTPPPPPPCPIQSAGCYKTGDIKAGFGELAPGEFGYFLPENKCKSTSSCDCRGIPADIPQQTNPDDSSGACTCIAGTDWNAKAKCCGDDTEDCGRISSGVLCSIDANGEAATWVASTPNLGDIRYVGCLGLEYLSDGNNWIKCEGTFWRKTIGNSEYVCIGKGRESIVECCGDGSCKSRLDGKRLSTGQSMDSSDSKTYYCRSDRKFVTDLDTPNSQISDTALNSKNKAACEKAGFKWTGTKCCSEADDANEYYNDPNGIGGCWNKKPIISINFVDGTADSVVNFNGEFHGCAIDKTEFNKNNNHLLDLADKHTGGPLITNHDYCFNDPDRNYYCSYAEKWLPTDGSDRTHFSLAPIQNPNQKGECCAQNECWDGNSCIENQKANPLAQPINGLRCIDGLWQNSTMKQTSDGTTSGYCPSNTQCLLSVFGRDEASQCIESESFIDDNYCENGEWSSRTKLLALKLLKLKSGDFMLFCDNRENTLNNLQYLTESNEIASSILTNLKTNNFCILKAGSKVVAATSINKNLEDVPSSSLNIFGIKDCSDGLIDDGQYHSCDVTNKVWFNKRLKSFIYSKDAITVPAEEEPSSFEEFIGNPIQNIIDAIKRLVTSPPFDESYLKGIKKFDKLYMAQQGTKSVRGSMEGAKFKNIIIEYIGFETDICKFAEQYNQAKKDASSGISCKNEGNNYYILAQGSQFTNINPESIWSDLTAKLRLK